MRMKISDIKINPGRRDTQQRNVEELARSIAAVGLMNPITVTQEAAGLDGDRVRCQRSGRTASGVGRD